MTQSYRWSQPFLDVSDEADVIPVTLERLGAWQEVKSRTTVMTVYCSCNVDIIDGQKTLGIPFLPIAEMSIVSEFEWSRLLCCNTGLLRVMVLTYAPGGRRETM